MTTALIIAAIVVVGAIQIGVIIFVWYRLRQQIDSYGATVGEAVDYLDLKNKEK